MIQRQIAKISATSYPCAAEVGRNPRLRRKILLAVGGAVTAGVLQGCGTAAPEVMAGIPPPPLVASSATQAPIAKPDSIAVPGGENLVSATSPAKPDYPIVLGGIRPPSHKK
jgi:hypothetical protein